MSAFGFAILCLLLISGSKAQFTGLCTQMKNPLGTCDCPGNTNQLWINADCTEGFMCETLDNPINDEVEGCEIQCQDTQILKVDPRSPGSWECVSKDDALAPICPGAFHTECACTSEEPEVDCPIGECQCDGQLRINHDCTQGKYCGADSTHEDISCDDGEIVIVNYAATEDTWLWMCGPDDGRCPGAFQVGCEPDETFTTSTTTTTTDPDAPTTTTTTTTTEPDAPTTTTTTTTTDPDAPTTTTTTTTTDPNAPTTTTTTTTTDPEATTTKSQFVGLCTQMKNPLGTCDCPGNTNQLWINADCTEGFMCETLDNPINDEVEGCEIQCLDTQILKVDPRSPGSWECVSKDDAMAPICPGAFHTECACTSEEPEVDCPIGECQCEGQLRINHDCTQGKYCGANDSHEDISCEDGEIVIVNYAATDETWLWMCGPDDGRCPGAFQVGCDLENGASSIFSVGAIIMVVVLFAGSQI